MLSRKRLEVALRLRWAHVVGLVDDDQQGPALLPAPPQAAEQAHRHHALLLCRRQAADVEDERSPVAGEVVAQRDLADAGPHPPVCRAEVLDPQPHLAGVLLERANCRRPRIP